MNNTYFNKDIFPDMPINKNNINQNIKLNIPMENLYLENIINQNKGNQVIIHMSFPNNENINIKGIIEQSGEEFIIISEPATGIWHLLPIKNINYISFNENINYEWNIH